MTYQGPPRFNFINGKRLTGTQYPDVPSDFYIRERELKGMVPGAPWKSQQGRFAGNSDEIGYQAPSLNIIIISRRSQPFRQIDLPNNKKGREWHTRWIYPNATPEEIRAAGGTAPSESVHTEYLCLAEGLYDPGSVATFLHHARAAEGNGEVIDASFFDGLGLSVWTMKGSTGMGVDAALKLYRETLLREASKIASQAKGTATNLPDWAFSLPFGPKVDKKGKPVFEQNKKFQTVYTNPPTIYLPEKVDNDLIEKHYVGADMLALCGYIYRAYRDWRNTMQVNKAFEDAQPQRPVFGSVPGGRAAAGNGHGDMDVDDIPFHY
jgi:hypothetical protein